MSSKFKVIFREEEGSPEGSPKYEPGCPLLIAAVQISRNTETGDSFLQARATNVSNNLAEEVRALAKVSYSDGSVEEISLGGFDADVKPGADHVFAAAKLSRSDAKRADVRIILVKGAGEAWESKEGLVEVPLPKDLEISDELKDIRRTKLAKKGCRKAVGATKKAVNHGAYWSCACAKGHVNVGNRCVRCGLLQQDAMHANDIEALKKEAEEKRESEKRLKAKLLKIMALIAAIIAMLLLVASQVRHCSATATGGSGVGAYVVTKQTSYNSEGEIKTSTEYKLGRHGDVLQETRRSYSSGKLESRDDYYYEYDDYGIASRCTLKSNQDPTPKHTYERKVTSTDEFGQPTEIEVTRNNASGKEYHWTYRYDWYEEGQVGKITEIEHGGAYEDITTRYYNRFGKITSFEYRAPKYGSGFESAYKYDDQGHIISKVTNYTHKDKETTRYECDSDGNIVKVTHNDGDYWTYEYDSDGNIVKATYDDGDYTIYEYEYINNVSSAVATNRKYSNCIDEAIFPD